MLSFQSEKDLKALKKDDLVRLVMDHQNLQNAAHYSRNSVTSITPKPGRSQTSATQLPDDSLHLRDIVKAAVCEAVHELKDDLKKNIQGYWKNLNVVLTPSCPN